MTGKERGTFDLGNELADFHISEPSPVPSKPEKKAIQQAGEAAGFKSREPKTTRPQRRHRTGRNAQLNIKVTPETMQAFYAVADKHGWVLGEAMEKAVELLEREYS